MQSNPFKALLMSRKFWLTTVDAIVSAAALILGWYLAPEKVQGIMALIAIMQPVVITIIGAIAYEDAATIKAAGSVTPE